MGEVWSDLGGRYSQEARGLQLVDASVQDANAWEGYFDQVCCKLKKEGKKVTHHNWLHPAYAFSSSPAQFAPCADCCNDAVELPRSRNTERTCPRLHKSPNPANRLCLSENKTQNSAASCVVMQTADKQEEQKVDVLLSTDYLQWR